MSNLFTPDCPIDDRILAILLGRGLQSAEDIRTALINEDPEMEARVSVKDVLSNLRRFKQMGQVTELPANPDTKKLPKVRWKAIPRPTLDRIIGGITICARTAFVERMVDAVFRPADPSARILPPEELNGISSRQLLEVGEDIGQAVGPDMWIDRTALRASLNALKNYALRVINTNDEQYEQLGAGLSQDPVDVAAVVSNARLIVNGASSRLITMANKLDILIRQLSQATTDFETYEARLKEAATAAAKLAIQRRNMRNAREARLAATLNAAPAEDRAGFADDV